MSFSVHLLRSLTTLQIKLKTKKKETMFSGRFAQVVTLCYEWKWHTQHAWNAVITNSGNLRHATLHRRPRPSWLHATRRGPRDSTRVYTCKVAIEIIRRHFVAQYVDSAECRSRRTSASARVKRRTLTRTSSTGRRVEVVGVPVTV